MDSTDTARETDGIESSAIDRRRVLQVVAGSAVTLGALTGTASAHASQFFGCSQVCSDTHNDLAVVNDGGNYECREMGAVGDTSDRRNVPWDHQNTYCYEVSSGEAIVGILEHRIGNTEDDCLLCVNPNNCASNYYDSVEEIVADLNADSGCRDCSGEITTSGNCDVVGSSGGRGNGNENGNGNGGGNGNGKP